MKNLKSKSLDMGVQWDIWCYRHDHAFSWNDDWLREASWSAAQEATAIEVRFANSRVKQWRKLIAEVIGQGDKQAHRSSKLPTMWMQADIHPTEGVQSHAARLQADLEEWKHVWRYRDGERSFGAGLRLQTIEQEVKLMTSDDIRMVATTFKMNTASGIDNLGPKNVALLSDDALSAFAKKKNAEGGGRWGVATAAHPQHHAEVAEA
eukprot:3583703-Pyramimonas_sp.AAC.1